MILKNKVVIVDFTNLVKKKKKVKIFIVSIPIIIMVWWLGYRNNLQLEKDNVLVTLDCKLNDKIYSYEIVYDDESNLYKIKPNSSLLIEMQKTSEEELENIIKNIFINKGGTCNSDDNLVINIDLDEE